MRILDLDMDYFLSEPPSFIPENSTERVDGEWYKPWNEKDVITFLENNLGLKNKKIKGKIINNNTMSFNQEKINSLMLISSPTLTSSNCCLCQQLWLWL